jgi:hypothetical protein
LRLEVCIIVLILCFFFAEKEKQKNKNKNKSLGEIQVKMKCQMEPSSEITKLDCKDWPLLFKVFIYRYLLILLLIKCNELFNYFRILIKC